MVEGPARRAGLADCAGIRGNGEGGRWGRMARAAQGKRPPRAWASLTPVPRVLGVARMCIKSDERQEVRLAFARASLLASEQAESKAISPHDLRSYSLGLESRFPRVVTRLKRLFSTDDSPKALGYAFFLWSGSLRATWLLLDILPSDAGGAIGDVVGIPLLALTVFTLPLTDLAGIGTTICRLRESRFWLMALATAMFWGRGSLAPELCGSGFSEVSRGATGSLCQQVANHACAVILVAVCLDKCLFAPRLQRWVRYLACAFALSWVFVVLDHDRLFTDLAILTARHPSTI